MKVPDKLEHGSVILRFEDCVVPGNRAQGLVPYHHFKVMSHTGGVLGHINLRIGDTRHVVQVAGHVGFEILPEFRGHNYSLDACKALEPYIRDFYSEVILTVDPANVASLRIVEKLGATFINEVDVPSDDPAYRSGARRKRRYSWLL